VPLARAVEQRRKDADREPLEMVARGVRVERCLVDVLLVEKERVRVLGILRRDVELATRFLT